MEDVKRFFDTAARMKARDLIALLMMATLMVYGGDFWYTKIPMLGLSIVALISEEFRRSLWMWYLSALVLTFAIYLNWYVEDNHKYVLVYICLALGLSYCVAPGLGERMMRQNGRWLLALSMGLAVVWKLRAGDYLNGDFFSFTLLTDARFASFTHWLMGVDFTALTENRAALKQVTALEILEAPLRGVGQVKLLALFMTWWTVIIEAVIGLMFLLTVINAKKFGWYAHALLCLFIVSTYSVATVPGFCLALVMLGIAATEEEEGWWRAVYVAGALLVQLYSIPFASVLGLI